MSSWQRNWKMNVGKQGLQDAEFRLEKHFGDGIIYYSMRVKSCQDEDTWDECFLVTRGRAHLKWKQTPLPEWVPNDSGIKTKYENGIKAFLARVTAATRRLEGDVEAIKPIGRDPIVRVVATPLAVTMLIAKDAVKIKRTNQRRDLLIVVIRSEGLIPSGTRPAPDGTGHGDPH